MSLGGMTNAQLPPETTINSTTARAPADWIRILAPYRTAETTRSIREVVITLLPFFALWGLAWWSLSGPRIFTFMIAMAIGFMVVRTFCLQHDCGHYALFKNRRTCDWLGRALGILTITPYDTWRVQHASHHQNIGNLNASNMGEITTLTVAEYKALNPRQKVGYWLYRNPITLFVIAPFYLFFLKYRLPFGLMSDGWRPWVSSLVTDLCVLGLLAGMYAAAGWAPILWIFLPSTLLAASIGIWMFYVHHQFEDTHFYEEDDWQVHEAALHASSIVVMPAWLQWLTANIMIHHVHHLHVRIPFYKLPDVIADYPELAAMNRMTLLESLKGINLNLWDAEKGQLVSFAEVRRSAI